jgi:hypothetical protein
MRGKLALVLCLVCCGTKPAPKPEPATASEEKFNGLTRAEVKQVVTQASNWEFSYAADKASAKWVSGFGPAEVHAVAYLQPGKVMSWRVVDPQINPDSPTSYKVNPFFYVIVRYPDASEHASDIFATTVFITYLNGDQTGEYRLFLRDKDSHEQTMLGAITVLPP